MKANARGSPPVLANTAEAEVARRFSVELVDEASATARIVPATAEMPADHADSSRLFSKDRR
jgi:hypothetical protein